MTAYMLMRVPTRNYRGLEPELVDIYLNKQSAQKAASEKNAYTRQGRTFDYVIRTKKVKD